MIKRAVGELSAYGSFFVRILLRFHDGPKDLIGAGLVPSPVSLQPRDDIGIKSYGDKLSLLIPGHFIGH